MNLLNQKYSEKYYDSWETVDSETRTRHIASELDRYIQFANQLPFYRERLTKYDATSPHPLAEVPVLTSSDLRELLPPESDALIVDKTLPYNVFQSGGTTGVPKTTLFSHEELEQLNLPNARGFFALGLSEKDRVGNLFAVGGLYMTFIHINRMLQQYGCINFPFSNYAPVEFVHTVVKLFNVNCLTGISSVVLDCLRGMAKIGMDGIRVEKILYGGEHLYEADKQEIREKYGASLIAAPGYGTVDTWYLGYQCLQCPTGVFHAHDDQCYLEIVNEDKGQSCSLGEVGMLYATPFPRRLTPVIRYRVGDRTKWLPEPCPCGRTTPLFKLLGRGDDVLRIGYDSIDYNSVQEILSEMRGLTGTLQMEKQREQGKDRLILRVETELEAQAHASTIEKLIERLISLRPVLREFVHKETIWPIEVELVGIHSIARNNRTGKLTRVIDSVGESD